MKGPEVSLKHLQRAIIMELSTVNAYILQARQLEDWGVDRLAARMLEEAAEEREHAVKYIDRMLFLEGVPDMHSLDPVPADSTVRGVLETQMKLEREAQSYYTHAAEETRAGRGPDDLRPLPRDPRRRGGPHRLPRDAVRPHRDDGRAALHRAPRLARDRRGVTRPPDGGPEPPSPQGQATSTQTGRWSEATRAARPRSTPWSSARSPGPSANRSSEATGRAAWNDRPGATTS